MQGGGASIGDTTGTGAAINFTIPQLPKLHRALFLQWTPGEVMLVFSAEEVDELAKAHPRRLLVLEASFTWCRPCKGFARAYQKFADAYRETIFLKVQRSLPPAAAGAGGLSASG